MKRIGWLYVFAACVACILAIPRVHAYQHARASTNEAAKLKAQAEKKYVGLAKKRAELEGAVGKQKALREQGYLAPGEKPLDP